MDGFVVEQIPSTFEACCYGDIFPYNGKLFFAASSPVVGRELFYYDPATNTADLFADLVPGIDESSPQSFTEFEGWMVFASYSTGVWMSDGTPEGTMLIFDQVTFDSFSEFVEFNGDLYFSYSDSIFRILGSGNGNGIPPTVDGGGSPTPGVIVPPPYFYKGTVESPKSKSKKSSESSKTKGMRHRAGKGRRSKK